MSVSENRVYMSIPHLMLFMATRIGNMMISDYDKQSNVGGISVLPHFQMFRQKRENTFKAFKQIKHHV
jgi:hypothetical protein